MTDPEAASERAASPAIAPPQPPSVEHNEPSIDPSSFQPEQQDQEQPPQEQPPFQPLFTLITDTTTRATHHPRVHYIFSDDDPDILTEALAHHHYSRASAEHERDPSPASSSNPSSNSSSSRPTERAIVLDLVPKSTDGDDASAGYEVAWASSLSSDWAVVSARVSSMEGEEGVEEDQNNEEHKLMLRIEGVGIEGGALPGGGSTRGGKGAAAQEAVDLQLSGSGGKQASSSTGSGQQQQQDDYGVLIDEFEKRMGVLRKVVDAGEERQRKVAAQEAADMALEAPEVEEPAEMPITVQAAKHKEQVNKEGDGGD